MKKLQALALMIFLAIGHGIYASSVDESESVEQDDRSEEYASSVDESEEEGDDSESEQWGYSEPEEESEEEANYPSEHPSFLRYNTNTFERLISLNNNNSIKNQGPFDEIIFDDQMEWRGNTFEEHINRRYDNKGNTLLIKAVDKNDIKMIEKLVAIGADLNIKNKYGNTALYEAIRNHNIKIVQFLINADANLNLQITKNYGTALHEAVEFGFVNVENKIIKKIIEAGVNLDIQNKSGDTPLHLAVKNYCKPTYDLLVISNNSYDYNQAINNNSYEIIKLLIGAGANPNIHSTDRSSTSMTPLNWLAQNYKYQAAQLLITHGADVNLQDEFGNAALHNLVLHINGFNGFENPEEYEKISLMVRLLIDAGADVNHQDESGRRPLDLAYRWLRRGSHDVVKHLFTINSIDINKQNKYGETPERLNKTLSLPKQSSHEYSDSEVLEFLNESLKRIRDDDSSDSGSDCLNSKKQKN